MQEGGLIAFNGPNACLSQTIHRQVDNLIPVKFKIDCYY